MARLIPPDHLALATLMWSSCGYFGIELRDEPPPDDGLHVDATAPLEAADGSVGPSDGSAVPSDGSAVPSHDGGATGGPDGPVGTDADAQVEAMDARVGPSEDGGSVPDLDASTRADADAQSASTDARVGTGPGSCDFSGTWVARLDATISWSQGILQAGSGPLTLWLKYQSNANGSIVNASLVQCGMAAPDYRLQPLLGNEAYGVNFPTAVFDATPARVVATNTALTVQGAGNSGDTFTIAPTAIVLGTRLNDPLNDAWPAASAMVNADQDLDGQPGVTVAFRTGVDYALPFVNLQSQQRAERAGLAARTVWNVNGTFGSCSSASGIAVLTRYDTHMVSCILAGGTTCSSAQRDMLNANLPTYTIGSANYRATKLANNANCAAARSALP